MASSPPLSAGQLNFQLPNSNAPIGDFSEVDISGLRDSQGGTLTGVMRGIMNPTPAWRYMIGQAGQPFVTTVAKLPRANRFMGNRQYSVTDSTVTAAGNFGAIVLGSGKNFAPVYSDGANWRIG